MSRHPPDENENLARMLGASSQVRDLDKLRKSQSSRGVTPGFTCPLFSLAQQTQNDNLPRFLSDSVVSVFELSVSDYTPDSSPRQKCSTNLRLLTLAALMARTRKVKDESDRAGNDDAWLKGMDYLWLLHESYNQVKGGAA